MRTFTCALAALGALTLAPSVHAVIIFSDNFDGYANQAAFEAAWTPIGTLAPTSATLSSAESVSPSQSVLMPVSTSNGQQRNRISFAESSTVADPLPGTKVIWSFDFFDSNAAVNPARNYLNLQDGTAPSLTGQLVSMGLNNNQVSSNSGGNFYMARILGFSPVAIDPDGGPNELVTGTSQYFKLNDFGVGLRSTGWHNLKVIIASDDNVAQDYYFYVDGQLAERVLNIGTAIRSYDNVVIGSGFTNASTIAYADNVIVQTPEPASLALAGGMLAVLLGRRR